MKEIKEKDVVKEEVKKEEKVWEKPKLDDVSEKIMAQPYMRKQAKKR